MTQARVPVRIEGPRTPSELMQRFSALVSQRDLDGLLALYEPDAVFTPRPGVVLQGRAQIGPALGELLALSPSMQTNVKEVQCAGDVALVIVEWSLRGRGPDGSEVHQSGTSADVLRRQPDGSWRVLIDHP